MYGSFCRPCLTQLWGLGRLTWLYNIHGIPALLLPLHLDSVSGKHQQRIGVQQEDRDQVFIWLAPCLPGHSWQGLFYLGSSMKATVCLSSCHSSLQAPISRPFLVPQRPWHGQCSSSLQPSPSFLGFPNPAHTLVISTLIQSSATALFGCAVSQGILVAEHACIWLLHSRDPRSSNSDSNCIVVPGFLRREMCASEKALSLLGTYQPPND